MPKLRHERVRELLKRTLGEIIRREIPIDQAGLVTVNDIALAGDLQSATVYVGVVGPPAIRQKSLQILEENRVHLQSLLGGAVVLKYTPRLRFELDTAIERGNRVLAILDEIQRDEPPQG